MKTRADLLFIKEAIEEAASEEIGKKSENILCCDCK